MFPASASTLPARSDTRLAAVATASTLSTSRSARSATSLMCRISLSASLSRPEARAGSPARISVVSTPQPVIARAASTRSVGPGRLTPAMLKAMPGSSPTPGKPHGGRTVTPGKPHVGGIAPSRAHGVAQTLPLAEGHAGCAARSAHALRAVEGLADDVGVAGVLGGLGDDVHQHPSRGPAGSRLEPGRAGQRVRGVQVEGGEQLVGPPGD